MNTAATNAAIELPLGTIHESKFPLRHDYDEEAIRELGESVSEIGPIYPIVVRPLSKTGTKFELVIGSRRLKAAQARKARTIPAVILSNVDDRQSLVLALSENLKREDLTPFEEAAGFLTLIKTFKMSEKEVARALSCAEIRVRNRLKLLSLSPEVQELAAERRLGINQLDTIASLPEKVQSKFANAAVAHALSESELATFVRQELTDKAVRPMRRHPERFTGKRVSLKIHTFADWLDGIAKHIAAMPPKDRREIKEALDALAATLSEVARQTK